MANGIYGRWHTSHLKLSRLHRSRPHREHEHEHEHEREQDPTMVQETPSRRSRLAHEGDTRDPKRQRRRPDLFFSALDRKTLRHILRLVSSKARVDQWLSFIDAATAASILRVGGPLSSEARALYTSVDVRAAPDAGDWCVPAPKLAPRGGAIAFSRANDTARHLLPLVRELAGSLADVRMELPARADALAESVDLAGVRRLSLWTPHKRRQMPLARMLAGCRGSLEALELRMPTLALRDVFDIVAHVRGVRRLALSFASVEAALAPVWEMQGMALEELHVRRDVGDGEEETVREMGLERLSEMCANVKVLSFTGFRSEGMLRAVEEVCKGYGERLESLKIVGADLMPEYRARVNAACPNVSL